MREDYYKKRRTDGTVVQRRRTEWQNKAIRSLKKDDLHVRTLLDTTEIWKLAEEQEKLSARKLKQREDSEAARYVAQIENTFRALHYTEQNEFESYGQMLNVIKAIHRDYAEILVKKEEAEKLVSERERNLRVPEQIAELKERMHCMKSRSSPLFCKTAMCRRTTTGQRTRSDRLQSVARTGFSAIQRTEQKQAQCCIRSLPQLRQTVWIQSSI